MTATIAPTMDGPRRRGMSWLEQEHPDYAKTKDQWQYATDHYTADVLAEANLSTYLVRKSLGESDAAYNERKKLCDYTPHFATLVDELAGMAFSVEADANRRWHLQENLNTGLGDPQDTASPAYRLRRNVTGRGVGWMTLWKQLAVELFVNQQAWILVDTADGLPVARMVPALDVVNWVDGPRGPVEVLLQESVEGRDTLAYDGREPAAAQRKSWVRFTLAGWERWSLNGEGDPVMGATGQYKYVDPDGRLALPIFRVELPMRRHVGYILARKCNAIFNQESARDWLLRVANFPRLNVMGSELTFEAVEKAINAGSNLLQNEKGESGHNYIAPDTSPATVAGEALKRKVEEFWVSGYREYGDAAREMTATEIKQTVAAGVGAALQMLVAALDDGENGAFWRLEQATYSQEPGRWFAAHVERSEDFAPMDVNLAIEQQMKRYFGDQPIPLGRTGQIEIAKKIALWEGIKVDEGEIERALDANNLNRIIATFETLPVPALVKARLAIMVAKTLGLVTEDGKIVDGAGEERREGDFLMGQAERLAAAMEEAKIREAEAPGINADANVERAEAATTTANKPAAPARTAP